MRSSIKYFLAFISLALYSLCNAQSITADNPRKLFHINNGWNGAPDTMTLTDTDADAFIAAAGITNSTQKNAIKRLVMDLKGVRNDAYATANIWSKFLFIYPFVGGTSSSCKYNLKDPRDLDAAYRLTFNGTPSFSDSGVLFLPENGDIADTHMNMQSVTTDIGDSTQCSASLYMAWNDDVSGFKYCMGVRDAVSAMQFDCSAKQFQTWGGGGIGINTTYDKGFYLFSKESLTLGHLYFNGVKGAGIFNQDIPPINFSLAIGGLNSGGGFAPSVGGMYQFASFGNIGLTTYECICFSNAVKQFQTTLNRQVFN